MNAPTQPLPIPLPRPRTITAPTHIAHLAADTTTIATAALADLTTIRLGAYTDTGTRTTRYALTDHTPHHPGPTAVIDYPRLTDATRAWAQRVDAAATGRPHPTTRTRGCPLVHVCLSPVHIGVLARHNPDPGRRFHILIDDTPHRAAVHLAHGAHLLRRGHITPPTTLAALDRHLNGVTR